jgi:hypothetical protein
MRDRNRPTLAEFDIQFKKVCLKTLSKDTKLSRTPVSDTTTLLDPDLISISYPRSFRHLRALIAVHWFISDQNLFWRIHLDLEEKSFSWLNKKQKLILSLILASREVCETYFYETRSITGSELFGNVLGTDLKESLRFLKFRRKKYKLIPVVYRRGYRDKGARKRSDQWLPSFDAFLTESQILKEKEQDLHFKLKQRLQKILENIWIEDLDLK